MSDQSPSTSPDRLTSLEQRVDDHDSLIKSIDSRLAELVDKIDKWQKIGLAIATGVLLNGGGDAVHQLISALVGN